MPYPIPVMIFQSASWNTSLYPVPFYSANGALLLPSHQAMKKHEK
jgi:hypothetical protein